MPEILKGMESFFGRGRFEIKPFADGVCCYIGCFGNVGVVETDEGLILFDLAIRQFGRYVFNAVRNFSDKPVKYIIYSHGHFDHCFGYAPFIKEIKKKEREMPQIIAHENLLKRFAKYRMLENHQAWSYRQQFLSAGVSQSDTMSIHERLDPTIVLRGNEDYTFKLGDFTFEIYHDKGETDDSIWMYFPEKKVLFTGDLFVSSFPNVGSPFRVQRYAKDWALANEKMREKNAEYLLPGHGRLIEGKDKIREVLSITAESMHFVHDEVVKRLNEGKWFEEIYHEMLEIFPEKFKNHRYLKPQYGDYRFAIHDVYRLYHGWYDSGNPTDLFSAKSDDVAKEFLKVADGEKFLDRANQLVEEGKPQLALHVLDVIIKADDKAPPDTLLNALKLKHKIVKEKAKEEESFIAKNILNTSALQI
ncbi:MAG: MBL fold metallo-hydrolase, partial [Promethearchaeota archaeon]